MSAPGRPKGEHRSAQHEGTSVSAPGRPEGEHRGAQHEGTPTSASPAANPSSHPFSCLAFDFGTRRVGVATGNTLVQSARPLRTIDATGAARFDAIAAVIAEWQPAALVVGVPRHPDGAPHDNTARAQRFARQLQGRFGLPVHEVDERYTTVEAIAGGASDLDAASAALILEQYFRERAT